MNKKIIALFSVVGLLLLPVFVVNAINVPDEPGGNIMNFRDLIAPIMSLMWQIFIVIFFIILFVSAFLFLTAQGDEGKLGSARQALIWASIALIIAVISWSLPQIIMSVFVTT